MKRNDYLELARKGIRMPVGADLVLHDYSDREAILVSGDRLGEVIAETARRFRTPLAVPLMDLTIEKSALLEMLNVPADQAPTYHFTQWPEQDPFARIADRMPTHRNARLEATCGAIEYVARETNLVPIGMTIGPLSLLVKILGDPITAIFMAGRGRGGPQVELLEKLLELGTRIILWSVEKQLRAGAKALFVCEPAASVAYISPRQLATGANLLETLVLKNNRRIKEKLDAAGAELIFHCCGELTPEFIQAFVTLRPVMLSLGASRKLWEDAALVPTDIVLYGNLPTKSFYSDEVCPPSKVEELTRELLTRMRETGHPFILGSECDVLSVEGAHECIRHKVETFMAVQA